MRKQISVTNGKAAPAKAKASEIQKDLETALREVAQLQATNLDLSVKLRQQIARGNKLKERLVRAGITVPTSGVDEPASPVTEAAARAYLRAHPDAKTCTKGEVQAWLASGDRAEHSTR